MAQFASSTNASQWIPFSAEVGAGSVVDTDVQNLAGYRGRKYIVSVYSDSELVYKSFEMLTRKKGDNSLAKTIYAKIGDSINVHFDLLNSSGNVSLRITNNEAFAVNVKFYKIIMS